MSFKIGDEVYIKGVVRKIESDDGTYPVRVNLTNEYRIGDFTLGGLAKITHTERSLFHASEIKREYKIGQKLNGFAEVMQALVNGQVVECSGSTYKVDDFNILYWNAGRWDKTSRSISDFTRGTIVEDPTPKKMVAMRNSGGQVLITEYENLTWDECRTSRPITKQELAAILERVE